MKNTGYLFFENHWAAVTPEKYGRDLWNLAYILTKYKYSEMEKLVNSD